MQDHNRHFNFNFNLKKIKQNSLVLTFRIIFASYLEYSITFPMFGKIDVNGANVAPLYKFLKSQAPGLLGTEGIKWNFTKFLIDKSGKVVKRYAPTDAPVSMEADIEALL
jgi:glutathione peroxidase-family protein